MGDATQVGLVRTACFAWAMQHRWIVAPNPVLMEFASKALFWCEKNVLLPLLERRDVALRK